MNIPPVMQSALQGVRRGIEGLDRSAAAVARAAGSEGQASVVKPLVAAMSHRLQVQASASVLRTVDQTLGTLLDEKA
ncbi:MAG: hypothetical protein AB7U81_02900 [Thiohalomonadaceae bacterium]